MKKLLAVICLFTAAACLTGCDSMSNSQPSKTPSAESGTTHGAPTKAATTTNQ